MEEDELKELGELAYDALSSTDVHRCPGVAIEDASQIEKYYESNRPDLNVAVVASHPSDIQQAGKNHSIVFKRSGRN